MEWRQSGRIALNSFNFSDSPLWTESEVWIKRRGGNVLHLNIPVRSIAFCAMPNIIDDVAFFSNFLPYYVLAIFGAD